MTALAYIIAVSDYAQHPLKNPVRDAIAIESVLKRLGFIVKLVLNPDFEEFDSVIEEFADEVDKYNIGLFYYAGHGMQIKGENYLTAKDTPHKDYRKMKHRSIKLDLILEYMADARNETSIVILDTCRNNPFLRLVGRELASNQLAPVFAPKGTLVAFSTSPGETADDGSGDYSPYAQAILQHIETRGITIEEFFKRVRNSLFSATGGNQTSWEHTSLSGTFMFNSGSLTQSIQSPYSDWVVADGQYIFNADNEVDDIIKGLKSFQWPIQASALLKVKHMNVAQAGSDQLFVIGRCLLSAADGNEFKAKHFVENLERELPLFQQEYDNHVLNGMLFEVYFNSKGLFRAGKFKTKFFKQLMHLQDIDVYQKAFEFISTQLAVFRDELFYIPGAGEQSLSLNVEHELAGRTTGGHTDTDAKSRVNIRAIKWERKDVLLIGKDPYHEYGDGSIGYERYTIQGLKTKIASEIVIPEDLLTLAFNEQFEPTDIVFYPYYGIISKKGGANHNDPASS